MNQQLAYKILAAFLVFTMLGSVFAYIFIGSKDDAEPVTEKTNTDIYNEEFWTVNQPFSSISDALNLTPAGATTAQFMDIESMSPQMMQWARQDLQVIQEVDSLYKSNTTKMYYARIPEGKNESFVLLSTMYPLRNDFDYIVLPNTNYILQRQDTGAINIMGNPVIYAPDKTASDVLEIMYGQNKTNTSYEKYEGLLSKVDAVPYQVLNSNITFAKQFYMGIGLVNGSYERTAGYQDADVNTIKKINQLKANSTQNGFSRYDIVKTGNYTIVKISSADLVRVLNEETN